MIEKINKAISRIQNAPFPKNGVYVGHSGGKDSVLVTHLAFEALGKTVPVVHTPKVSGSNAVHPATRDFLYNLPYPVLYLPPTSEIPNGLRLNTQIDGTRRYEHSRQDGRSTNVVIDGKEISRENMPMYVEEGLFGKSFIYPIYDWTDDEVWEAHKLLNLPVSKEYL